MRATLISMCAVLALALALCFVSMFAQFHALDRLDDLRIEAVELLRAGDLDGANEKLVELANQFKKESVVLEMLASHDDLHDAYLDIVDAQVSLECRDWNVTFQSLALMGERLEHLRIHEGFSLGNLY